MAETTHETEAAYEQPHVKVHILNAEAVEETRSAHETAHDEHGGGIPELSNAITILSAWKHEVPAVRFLHRWENLVFSGTVAIGIALVAWRFGRKPALIPSGGQNFLELLVEGIDNFVRQVIGPAGREHTPFIGSLFIYIWMMNLSGLIPGFKSATSVLNTTIGLALAVFCYVQYFRVRSLGLGAYLHHLAGSPNFDDVKAAPLPLKLMLLPIKLFVMVVLFTLELVGEFVKPISLSLRLGFNVFAEDVLLAVLVGLGIAAGVALHFPIPIQFFVVPLVLIFSTVQALVFSLLTSVYISLMLPHEDHASHGEHH